MIPSKKVYAPTINRYVTFKNYWFYDPIVEIVCKFYMRNVLFEVDK